MESYKCDVCNKSFTGLVCYQQHEASEKHKRKVQLTNGVAFQVPKTVNQDQFHCPVCMVSILGLGNYQKHVISLDHAINVQKKNGDLLSQSLSSTFELKTEQSQSAVSSTSPMPVIPFAECKPCGKQFSGPEPYQQHLVSAGHQKKCGSSNEIFQSNETDFSIRNERINNNNQSTLNTSELKTEQNQHMRSPLSLASPIQIVAPFAECKPCGKQFSGPEPYQQHLASAGHKKKCGSSGSEAIQSFLSEADTHKKMPPLFTRCDICKIEFNEALPYQLHLVSESHKKQADDLLLGNSMGESQSAFKCDICVLKFTGPVPYQQHLVSIGHKKKISAAELSKQLPTIGSWTRPDSTFKDDLGLGQSSINDLQQWYCDVCKKQCSGPIPYNTHISSQNHLKNMRILEVQENLRKVQEMAPFPSSGNNEYNSNLFSQTASDSNLQSDLKSKTEETSKFNDLNINAKSNDTKILSDKFPINANDLLALQNLNIIPPEKLDVTVFGPDDEVVFSGPKNCKQKFPLEINEVKKVCDTEIFNENKFLMAE